MPNRRYCCKGHIARYNQRNRVLGGGNGQLDIVGGMIPLLENVTTDDLIKSGACADGVKAWRDNGVLLRVAPSHSLEQIQCEARTLRKLLDGSP